MTDIEKKGQTESTAASVSNQVAESQVELAQNRKPYLNSFYYLFYENAYEKRNGIFTSNKFFRPFYQLLSIWETVDDISTSPKWFTIFNLLVLKLLSSITLFFFYAWVAIMWGLIRLYETWSSGITWRAPEPERATTSSWVGNPESLQGTELKYPSASKGGRKINKKNLKVTFSSGSLQGGKRHQTRSSLVVERETTNSHCFSGFDDNMEFYEAKVRECTMFGEPINDHKTSSLLDNQKLNSNCLEQPQFGVSLVDEFFDCNAKSDSDENQSKLLDCPGTSTV